MRIFGVRKVSRFNYEIVSRDHDAWSDESWNFETNAFTERGAIRMAKRMGSKALFKEINQGNVKLVPLNDPVDASQPDGN